MTIKEALEVLRKQSNCWDKITECSANCEECECHTDASDLVEAVKTVLDAFGNCSELPNSSADLISRQAAIDVIEDIETARLQGEIGMIYAPAIKGLRTLPSVQPEQKWIPCKKKLPEESDTYIATLIDDGAYFTDVVEWNSTFGGRWQSVFYDNSPIGEYHDISNVVAWQPLPEPYRGEEHGL